MARLQVVGLGLSMVDILVRLKHMPTWDGHGRAREIRLDGGGPVGTALVAAARLGASAGFVGTAGNDDVAELRLRALAREGVDTSRVAIRDLPDDQVVLVYVHEETGERVFTRVSAGTDCVARNPLRIEELDRDYITAADCLLMEGFHYEAAKQAAVWMREAGKQVILDAAKADGPVPSQLRELVAVTDVLICGAGVAPALTGVRDIWEAARAALEMGPSIVVQTEGADGSYTVTATEQFHTPAFVVDVVDTTGAGDVFHGAYIVGLLQGWDLKSIASFASAVSAIKCTRLGGRAGIPRLEDVLAFLNHHDKAIC